MVYKPVPQLSPITDQLYLSGVNGVRDAMGLQKAKITHVLNVARELKDLVYPPNITVKFVSLLDSEEENLLPHLDFLADYIHEVISNRGIIAVHCIAGVSRSASSCIAYFIKHHGMTLKDAHAKVKAGREVIYPNIGFWSNLIEFEFDIRKENSVELLSYTAGTIPSLDCYKKEMMKRMQLGWMDHLFFNVFIMLIIFSTQMLSVFVFRD